MGKASKTPANTILPFGLWPSPIGAADVARGARRFGLVQGDGAWIYWTEGRPQEKGRQALLRRKIGTGEHEELLAAPWSARSRVHEYGGGEFLAAGDVVYFVNDRDQDIYALSPGGKPKRLTEESRLRFADFALDSTRQRLLAVAERHYEDGRQPDNFLVSVSLSRRRSISELVIGHDFFASPRLSPDGRTLAYLAWNLPDMPWDQAALFIADLDSAGGIAGRPRRISGGDGTAASHPSFAPNGALVFISDASDWGRVTTFRDGKVRSFGRLKCEFGRPMWSLASQPYAITADNRIFASSIATGPANSLAAATVAEIDIESGRIAMHERFPQLDAMSAITNGFVAQKSASESGSVIEAFSATPAGPRSKATIRNLSDGDDVFAAVASLPSPVSFPRPDGVKVHGFYYAPKGLDVSAPKGTLPPAIVLAHGGPTGMASRSLSPRIQFYTSRGFAVVDVDYAGSTGYGRGYRERLDGQWGIADVEDCVAAAKFLAKKKLADPKRIAIAGGSAGGYTVLMALATTAAFAAGSSHFGISDLTLLMEHTHKFESGYLHRLLGTTPKAWKKVCRQRSPLTHIDQIKAPLILFQGLDDRVVPPEQSRLIAEKLQAKGQLVELHEFVGEGHGFRRAETVVSVLQAEFAFLLRTLAIG